MWGDLLLSKINSENFNGKFIMLRIIFKCNKQLCCASRWWLYRPECFTKAYAKSLKIRIIKYWN